MILLLYIAIWLSWWFFPKYIGIDSKYDRSQKLIKIITVLTEVIGLIIAPIMCLVFPVKFGFIQPIGLAVMIGATVLQWLARKELGRYYTAKLCIMPGQKLVKTGVYKYCDHPGYVSSMLFLAGATVTLNNKLLMAISLVYSVALAYRVKIENLMLKELNDGAETGNQRKCGRLVQPG